MPVNIPEFEKPRIWGDGTDSSIGPQLNLFYWQRKALIDLKKEQYFSQLADVTSMPKHYGKEIVKYYYIPLLDDRNINDQGIDATGASVGNEITVTITDPDGMSRYVVGNGVDAATARADAENRAIDLFKNLGQIFANYLALEAAILPLGWDISWGTAVNNSGNLYGSSKDVGTIVDKLPTISETGGRVNRVGFTRVTIKGTMENFGFFEEYTRDSINFDTDSELMAHISRELLRGANENTEDCIQIDLLNAANVVYYGGDAISASTVTGNTGDIPSVITYDMLQRMETTLNNNRCPKDTKLIAGSRFIDTKTIAAARYCYIGSELKSTLLKMKDYHGEKAFVPIQQYADAGNIAHGEIGSIGHFRFIEVPEMMHWEGAGATVTSNEGYMEGNGKYNVYPMLIVGSESFTTIGFQTNGDSNKFEIIHVKPGEKSADRTDPYGKTGFYSIQWWYGFMVFRPEWIAVAKVVAEM
jgi:hypothetical protein